MKKLTGIIIKDKMLKTAVVEVERWVVHPIYKKRFLRHKKYHVENDVSGKAGDKVEIVETRPLSKTKRWKISKLIKNV